MKKCGYGILVGATCVLALFWNSPVTGTLLGFELLLLPVLYLLVCYFAQQLSYRLSVPARYVQKKEEFAADIEITNHAVLPVTEVSVELEGQNLFTGETFSCTDTVFADGKSAETLRLYLTSSSCGKILLNLKQEKVRDYLGVFTKVCKIEQKEEIFVLPKIHRIGIDLQGQLRDASDGQRYSQTRRGEDTSEVFDIREYHAGDTLHRVHWKLTAKTEDYLVKEYSYPVEQNLFLFLDLAENKGFRKESFLEIVASLSWSLQEKGFSHSVIWWEEESEELKEMQVSTEQEVYTMLEELCGAKSYEKHIDIRKLYEELKNRTPEKKDMVLSLDGTFTQGDVCERTFDGDQLEKELVEWKLEYL